MKDIYNHELDPNIKYDAYVDSKLIDKANRRYFIIQFNDLAHEKQVDIKESMKDEVISMFVDAYGYLPADHQLEDALEALTTRSWCELEVTI